MFIYYLEENQSLKDYLKLVMLVQNGILLFILTHLRINPLNPSGYYIYHML
jgi:hypothetical protein